MDRIDEVRTFPGRTFHDLVTLSRLAAWGLGPVPTTKNLSHEETTRRIKYRPLYFNFFFLYFINLIFLITWITTMRENKEKAITSGDEDVTAPPTAPPVVQATSVQAGKRRLPSRRGRGSLSRYPMPWT